MITDTGLLKSHILWLSAFVLALLLTPVSALAGDTENTQRDRFLQAEASLRKGQLQIYHRLYEELADYPLQPYLELQHLRRKLSKAEPAEIRRFLENHRGEPVADLLHRDWLDHLAGRKRWQDLLDFYTPQASVRRQCQRLQALIETGKEPLDWSQVEKIWLHGRSQPSACDPAFAAWEAAGKRTGELTWKRIELAMEAGQWRLARYLGKKLGDDEQQWVARWIEIYRDPALARQASKFAAAHPYREIMLAHAMRRLAARDGLAALALWQDLETRYDFPKAIAYQTTRRIALALERDPAPEAYAFINALQPTSEDVRLHTARFRAALSRQDWGRLRELLAEWPASEQAGDRWQYWQARALSASGDESKAKALFRRVARNRSYYGFLAADEVNLPYQLKHRDTPEDPALRARMENVPGIVRALELHALKRDVEARREWRYATRDLAKPGLKAAAVIARDQGWLDQAIFTLAKTGYWDDLELRFPLEYRELVDAEAQSHTLDEAWIYAVIRQESAFMRDARSHAGAMGLMQLMPATARSVARNQLKRTPPKKQQLLKPALNIALGSAYLKQLQQALQNNPVLATAAYNAGPHRVAKWLPSENLSADIWVELVPFRETQRYLKRVMSYMVIYDKRLGREPRRLRERMATVVALNSGATTRGG